MWRILAIRRDVKALIKESLFCLIDRTGCAFFSYFNQINLDFLVYKTTNYVIIISVWIIAKLRTRWNMNVALCIESDKLRLGLCYISLIAIYFCVKKSSR